MKHTHYILLFLLLLSIGTASAQKKQNTAISPTTRPKIGIALSGGGAKGAAHIGVLKYLEEIGMPIDYVTGTSMGSIIGGLYSLGYTPDELAQLIADIDWSLYMSNNVDRRFQSSSIRARNSTYLFSVPFGPGYLSKKAFDILSTLPSGVINGASLTNLFSRLSLGYNDSINFSQLPIPFSCVATDILTGDSVILNHGNFAKAIRSSMAIPGVFSPVEWNGHLLADGGMVNNFPVDLCLDMGADYVIGIELAEELASDPEQMKSLPQQLTQYLSIAVQNNRSENRNLCDVYMHPDITGYNMLSFSHAAIDTMVRRGYECAKSHHDELMQLKQRLINFPPDTPSYRPRKVLKLSPDDTIMLTSVIYKGILPSAAHWLISKGGLDDDTVTTFGSIENAVNRIMGTEAYSSITYNIFTQDKIVINNKPIPACKLIISFEPSEPHLLAIGFRYDSQEKASLLLHLGINEQRLSGFKFAIDANLNYNIRFKAKASWCNMGIGDFNLAYRYHNSTVNLNSVDSIPYSVLRVNHHNFSFFISEFHLRDGTFAFGFDEDLYSNINSFSLDNVIYDGIFQFDRAKAFFGVFLRGLYDNLDNAYFATHGIYANGNINWRIDNKNLFKQLELGFLDLNFCAQTYQPANDKLTIIPQLATRIVIGNSSGWYDNIIGGTIPGRFIDHQLAFIGLNRPVHVGNFVAIARVDFRYRLLSKTYLYLLPNVAYTSDWPRRSATPPDINFGVALRAAYDSSLGPISLDLQWNTFTHRMGLYLNIGHVF